METTTIAVTTEARDEIKQFGNKGETYSDIILRLVACAKRRQLHDLLMSEEGTIPIKEALEDAKKRWQR